MNLSPLHHLLKLFFLCLALLILGGMALAGEILEQRKKRGKEVMP